jgi:hypothetical protein
MRLPFRLVRGKSLLSASESSGRPPVAERLLVQEATRRTDSKRFLSICSRLLPTFCQPPVEKNRVTFAVSRGERPTTRGLEYDATRCQR